jgi:hypothetical protein
MLPVTIEVTLPDYSLLEEFGAHLEAILEQYGPGAHWTIPMSDDKDEEYEVDGTS